MAFRKSFFPVSMLILTQLLLYGCGGGSRPGKSPEPTLQGKNLLAEEMEKSLFGDLLDYWYPRNLDTLRGGYISDFDYDWTPSKGFQVKALVQQARHVWTTSFIYENYPEREKFLDYAAHGFRFLRDRMWDPECGGFFTFCNRDGSPQKESINEKRIYGQAFAVYGLSQYYSVSRDPEALDLARKAFLWMEAHSHDPQYGGYFEFLKRICLPGIPARPGSGIPLQRD
jgi:mannobiose 2-epimerase